MCTLMKCGHTANATDSDGKPVCAICAGLTPNAKIVDNKKPDLKGRIAKCNSCSRTTSSSYNLAFFEYKPDKEQDSYYCGCYGWD